MSLELYIEFNLSRNLNFLKNGTWQIKSKIYMEMQRVKNSWDSLEKD